MLSACSDKSPSSTEDTKAAALNPNPHELIAPGAPGQASHWAYAGKTGIGTAYETYSQGQYADTGTSGTVSKVWFSLAQGVVTETMFGLIHQAQLQEMQFFIQGENFVDEERTATDSHIEYIKTDAQGRPLSLAYKITNSDKEQQYRIEKLIFTDPDTQALMMRVELHALADGITPYLYVNPAIGNTGSNDNASYANNLWSASEGNTSMTLATDAKVVNSCVGFEGVSDGISELKQSGTFTQHYTSTGTTPGNVG